MTEHTPRAQRPTETVVPLAVGLGVVLLVAAAVNLVALTGFPGNAPIEQLYSIGITIDLAAAGVVLLVLGLVHRARPRAAARPPRPGPFGVVAAVLAFVVIVAWMVLGGYDWVVQVLAGERARYMYGVAGAFYAGSAWCLAFVFGALGYRRGGGTANSALSIGALAASFLVLLGVLAAGVVYGLALSD